MKLNLNIDFESWAEYVEFSRHFGAPPPAVVVAPPMEAIAAEPTPAPEALSKPTEQEETQEPVVYQTSPKKIKPYTPPDEIIEQVNQYIEEHLPFKTTDLWGVDTANPNYRSKINSWLRQHPDLIMSRQKTESRGPGPLVYTPIVYENGKAILPPAEAPRKTDWPIKGVTSRMIYRPPIVDDEADSELSEFVNPASSSDSQRAG